MTSLEEVYESFLSKMTEDEYVNFTEEELKQDMFTLLCAAIPWFKFPRHSLKIENNTFVETLTNEEIQILSTYMKCEWLNRTILTWENVKPLYDERDFSQANLIDKFSNLLINEKNNAKRLESIYYRSVEGKPYDYTKLAGDTNE